LTHVAERIIILSILSCEISSVVSPVRQAIPDDLSILSCEISAVDGVGKDVDYAAYLSILSCEIRIAIQMSGKALHIENFQFSLARSVARRGVARRGGVRHFQFSLARSGEFGATREAFGQT